MGKAKVGSRPGTTKKEDRASEHQQSAAFLGDLARLARAEHQAPSAVGLGELEFFLGREAKALSPGLRCLADRWERGGEEGDARLSPLHEGADGPLPPPPPSGCRRRAQGRRVSGAGAGGPRPVGRGQANEASRLPAAAERHSLRCTPTVRRCRCRRCRRTDPVGGGRCGAWSACCWATARWAKPAWRSATAPTASPRATCPRPSTASRVPSRRLRHGEGAALGRRRVRRGAEGPGAPEQSLCGGPARRGIPSRFCPAGPSACRLSGAPVVFPQLWSRWTAPPSVSSCATRPGRMNLTPCGRPAAQRPTSACSASAWWHPLPSRTLWTSGTQRCVATALPPRCCWWGPSQTCARMSRG